MNNQGCIFLEQGINFENNSVTDCCISHHDNRGLPLLIKNYSGGLIDWEEIFNIKEKRIQRQLEKNIEECDGCYHLGEYKFNNVRKISNFHFTQCRLCNAKCIYCSKEYSEGGINYDVYPVIKDLIDKGYYLSGGEACFQGGEPLVMQHFDELADLLIKNGTVIRVHTSGIKFSPPVSEALKQNKGTVVISLDCGTDKTYKKIKQADRFNNVIENIQKYAHSGADNVIIKYIIIPGINDNLEEIDKFFDVLVKCGIKTAALDIELQYARQYEYKYVSQHVYLIADYFEKKAAELNIKVLIYSFLLYVIQNRKLKKYPFVSIKPLYQLFINLLNDKKKNIAYCR